MADKFTDHNMSEVLGVIAGSALIGVIHFLYLLQRGRRFRVIDLLVEPCLAVLAGMMVWSLNEVFDHSDLVQGVLTSLAAWGGPRTINMLEQKYFASLRDPKHTGKESRRGE